MLLKLRVLRTAQTNRIIIHLPTLYRSAGFLVLIGCARGGMYRASPPLRELPNSPPRSRGIGFCQPLRALQAEA
jgi:hypothetical protein